MAATDRKHVVVVGAGAIGASVAYFLTKKGAHVTLVDRAGVATCASGKAGGFLARDWCSGALGQLARLSFELHTSLAAELGGAERYGFRALDTLSVPVKAGAPTLRSQGKVTFSRIATHDQRSWLLGRCTSGCTWLQATIACSTKEALSCGALACTLSWRCVPSSAALRRIASHGLHPVQVTAGVHAQERKKQRGTSAPDNTLPAWVDGAIVGATDVIGGPDATAQVHPRKFTETLVAEATRLGAQLVIGQVVGVALVEQGQPSEGVMVRVVQKGGGDAGEQGMRCDAVVFCMGPWTYKCAALQGDPLRDCSQRTTRRCRPHTALTAFRLAPVVSFSAAMLTQGCCLDGNALYPRAQGALDHTLPAARGCRPRRRGGRCGR